MLNTLWNPMNAMPADREFEVYHVVDGPGFNMASFHVHNHYEFYIYMSGSVDIAVEEKLYAPEPYALFIYPPGVMHRAVARPDLDRYERACGFNDYAGFYRAFVKHTGVTPQAFCKNGQQAEQSEQS